MKFKIGDKVYFPGPENDPVIKRFGEVINEINSASGPVYQVQFHDKVENIHYSNLKSIYIKNNAEGKVDPKQSQAIKKKQFDNIPLTVLLLLSEPCQNGADKYGPHNWLKLEDGSMSLQTYLNALQRHLILFKAGQDEASDSGIHHLDHMMAGLAIVRDAMLHGKVDDDRIKLSDEQIETLERLMNQSESILAGE